MGIQGLCRACCTRWRLVDGDDVDDLDALTVGADDLRGVGVVVVRTLVDQTGRTSDDVDNVSSQLFGGAEQPAVVAVALRGTRAFLVRRHSVNSRALN